MENIQQNTDKLQRLDDAIHLTQLSAALVSSYNNEVQNEVTKSYLKQMGIIIEQHVKKYYNGKQK